MSGKDVALWGVACAMALALFLIAPYLSADNTGRVVTALLSLAIFGCSIHPTLHSPWLHNHVSRRVVLCFVASGIAAFGWTLWPYSLHVTPSNVRFRNAAARTYSFRFTNRSDKDLYTPQLKFRIHSQTLSGKDFLIGIPGMSRNPYNEGGDRMPHFADIQGLLCRDSFQRSLFSIYVFHLAPHESREITITNRRAGSAKVGATTGIFSTSPEPSFSRPHGNGDFVSVPLRSDEPLSDCQAFGFPVDGREGMYWFNREGG